MLTISGFAEYIGINKKGKLAAAHRSTILSLLPSGPGEFNRSWSYRAYPGANIEKSTPPFPPPRVGYEGVSARTID